jgi:hypothetical protein
MLAGAQRGGRGLVVLVVCQGNHYGVEFIDGEDLSPVVKGIQLRTDDPARRFETAGAATAHGTDADTVELHEIPQMRFTAEPAGAE